MFTTSRYGQKIEKINNEVKSKNIKG